MSGRAISTAADKYQQIQDLRVQRKELEARLEREAATLGHAHAATAPASLWRPIREQLEAFRRYDEALERYQATRREIDDLSERIDGLTRLERGQEQ